MTSNTFEIIVFIVIYLIVSFLFFIYGIRIANYASTKDNSSLEFVGELMYGPCLAWPLGIILIIFWCLFIFFRRIITRKNRRYHDQTTETIWFSVFGIIFVVLLVVITGIYKWEWFYGQLNILLAGLFCYRC